MMFEADYSRAEVVHAHSSNYGYPGDLNHPRAIVLHTPEEHAEVGGDDYDATPVWFQDPRAKASTHYFVGDDGRIVQMVPENQGAYAQGAIKEHRIWRGVIGARPPWVTRSPSGRMSANLWAVSIEIEGEAAKLNTTMPYNGVQYKALIELVTYLVVKYDVPVDNTFIIGHEHLVNTKRDPGPHFPWSFFYPDVVEAVRRVRLLMASQPTPEPQPLSAIDRSSVTAALYSARESIKQALIYIEGPDG